jgi:hypothetical protein
MRILILVACLLFPVVMAAPAVAASVETDRGEHAVIFQFNGLEDLSLSSYSTGSPSAIAGIGYRRFLRDRTALRVGVAMNLVSETDKAPEGLLEVRNTDRSFGSSLVIERHLAGESVSPYVGLGVAADIGRRVQKRKLGDEPPPSPSTVTENVSKSFGIGAFGTLGFDWAFARSLTLGGEYRLGISVDSRKLEQKLASGSTIKQRDFSGTRFGVGTAALFLTVAL